MYPGDLVLEGFQSIPCHLLLTPPTTPLCSVWLNKIQAFVYLADGAARLGEVGPPRAAADGQTAER